MTGSIGFIPPRGSGPKWDAFYSDMDRRVASLGIDATAIPSMLYASQTYDAVAAVAHALSRAMEEEDWVPQMGKNSSRVIEVSSRILDQLWKMDSNETGFPSASTGGVMYFSPGAGVSGECRGPSRLDLVNQQGEDLVVVGYWSCEEGLNLRREDLLWSNGMSGGDSQLIQKLSQRDTCPPKRKD